MTNKLYVDDSGIKRFLENLKKLFAPISHTHTSVNGHTIDSDVPVNAKFTDTTYSNKTAVSGGTDVSLVTTGEKALWNSKTSNTGTITGIKMNGSSKGTSGVVDLGTVLTSGSQTTTSTADGGSNVYTFSDGSTITVKNGSKGSTGTNGTTPTIKVASGSSIGVVGTPSVTASTSGTTTTFTFNNLKGEKGDAGTNATTTAVATTSANGLMSSSDKTKLNGIATGANAYTHPTTSGNKHIPSGGSSGQILRWSADGTATWGADNNTTYSTGTTSALGLTKLYTGTGTATDGTMTQAAIKTAVYDRLVTLENTEQYINSFTIATGNWSNKTYTIKCSAIKANSIIQVYYAESQKTYLTSLDIEYTCGAGYLTLTANQTPTQAITVDSIVIQNPSVYSTKS